MLTPPAKIAQQTSAAVKRTIFLFSWTCSWLSLSCSSLYFSSRSLASACSRSTSLRRSPIMMASPSYWIVRLCCCSCSVVNFFLCLLNDYQNASINTKPKYPALLLMLLSSEFYLRRFNSKVTMSTAMPISIPITLALLLPSVTIFVLRSLLSLQLGQQLLNLVFFF